MAGIVPIVPPPKGVMGGKLRVNSTRFLTVNELRDHSGTVKNILNELEKKGWRFLLIDAHGVVTMEMDIEDANYVWQAYEAPRGGFAYTLNFDFGRRIPRLSLVQVVKLESCVINIRSQEYHRAVTVDLVTNEITYVHESLWEAKGKAVQKDACNVFEILKWLIEEKRFNFKEKDGKTHYQKLVKMMGGC
jgi:hypothetical protein